MADGLIIRRGGSAGTALNVIFHTRANYLPVNVKEDTIAVICSEVGTTYVQEDIPDGTESDIWITPIDMVFTVNLAKKGTILISVGNVYQYTEGEWVYRDAYIFRDGKWQYIWNKVIYENGKITENTEHLEMLSPATCTVTYGTSYIQCVTKSGSASEVYAVFGPIDLTDITTLIASGTYPKAQSGTTYAVLAVSTQSNTSFTDDMLILGDSSVKDTVKDNSAGKAFEVQLDVSGLTGDYYVYIGTNTAGGAWSNTRYVNFTALKGV